MRPSESGSRTKLVADALLHLFYILARVLEHLIDAGADLIGEFVRALGLGVHLGGEMVDRALVGGDFVARAPRGVDAVGVRVDALLDE